MSNIDCQVCYTSFYVKPSHQKLGWGKYCSVECRTKAQFKGKIVTCLICNKEAYRSPGKLRHSSSGHTFCSKVCQIKWRNSQNIGEKHPNWLTGINTYRNILLRSKKKQMCSICKIDNVKVLVAHHLDHNRENNKLTNLTWLCMNCHHLVHHDKSVENYLKDKILKI